MKRVLRMLALALALLAGVLWLTAGGHRGWTQTSVAVRSVDEVTGLEGITYKRAFVPGVDFLAVALLGAGLLGGASLFFRNQTKQTEKS